jgi:hypothetical protein
MAIRQIAFIYRIKEGTHVAPHALEQANDELRDLREGKFSGAAVLVP